MTISRTRLRGVATLDDAIALFAELGYVQQLLPMDLSALALPGIDRAVAGQSDRVRRRGYGLVIAETDSLPRSLRPLARSLRDHVHDRPLGVIGVTGSDGRWERMVVIRPRTAGRGGITVTRLEVDLLHPTQHDAQVLARLAWQPRADAASQRRIDAAFDVKAVTDRFFDGLGEHYKRMVAAVQETIDGDPAIADRLKHLGDDAAERTALRILTQVLFVQFLQRKGFVEGRKDWLSWAFRTKGGPYYQTVLERLFYAGLGVPADQRKAGDPEVPFLNGGLFERFYGPISLPLPDELFDLDEGLLGYLGKWTFTVHEDMPDEAEVAVDPEMLGKVFEHLTGEAAVEVHGTVYTPRPVVHFMCREALVPWLQEAVGMSEAGARTFLTDPDPFSELSNSIDGPELRRLAADIPEALDGLLVIDPAVGSGAFLLGMLAEIVRLRTLSFQALNQGAEPGADQITAWKNHAASHTLFGVDIEARAIELCRLRLWLSLLVDLPEGVTPQPLPNLEYRTVVADSLVDFVNGVEIQNTRGGLSFFVHPELEQLHRQWFHAVGEEREKLRASIREIENAVVEEQLSGARAAAQTDEERDQVEEIARRFDSPAREFPCFVPALHAPDVARKGGWDIVIMNPPYVGRKEVPRRLPASKVADLQRHYGWTNDLMIHFGFRALQLTRPRGMVSMIFNDSITSSTDGNEIRRHWADEATLVSVARTKCFEGRAITGGVVVVRNASIAEGSVRWVENHGRPVEDLADASTPEAAASRRGELAEVGTSEAWRSPLADYRVLPHRPLFRPSPEALSLLERFSACKGWDGPKGLGSWDPRSRFGWTMLSNTRKLKSHMEQLRETGFYDSLSPGEWILLGLVVEGGQGLATADDRRFLAAIEGTGEGAEHLRRQEQLARLTLEQPEVADLYRRVEAIDGREAALIAVWEQFHTELRAGGNPHRWPHIGNFRIAPRRLVRTDTLREEERREGIAEGPYFVPFEKGDDSDVVDGHAIGARWVRDNPVVIDWSTKAVSLLRERAARGGSRSPRFQSEHLWFEEGVAWNEIASYLRCRIVPEGSIFGHKAPTIRPTVHWLSPRALLALLNSDVLDFTVRTLLGSRMQIEVGDLRRLPVPVLGEGEAAKLDRFGSEAVATKLEGDTDKLTNLETKLNRFVRQLYGVPQEADLWVVR